MGSIETARRIKMGLKEDKNSTSFPRNVRIASGHARGSIANELTSVITITLTGACEFFQVLENYKKKPLFSIWLGSLNLKAFVNIALES